jgi:hypothetical protein
LARPPQHEDPTVADDLPQDDLTGTVRDPYAGPEEVRDPHEGAVPPGYDWPTHGGYLGCLLGLMASCLVTGFLGSTLVAVIAAPPLVRGLLDVTVAVVAILGLGRLGWVLGKRLYREYPPPRRRPAPMPSMADMEPAFLPPGWAPPTAGSDPAADATPAESSDTAAQSDETADAVPPDVSSAESFQDTPRDT